MVSVYQIVYSPEGMLVYRGCEKILLFIGLTNKNNSTRN